MSTASVDQPERITATGTVLSVPLNTIERSELNPRKHFPEAEIEHLAASIRDKGLLQPLLLRPHPSEAGKYEVVAGERRYRALRQLQVSGDIRDDQPIPATLRDVNDEALIRLAATENLQRQDMTPLEQADLFVQLSKLGDSVEAIAFDQKISEATVQKYLKLGSGLCADGRRALDAEQITLSQALALLMTSKGLQKEILPRVLEEGWDASDIKRFLTQGKVPVGRNIFPLETYTDAKGTITRDMFQPDHPGWFDDVELFVRLQNEAIEAKLTELASRYGEANVTITDYFMAWQYEEGEGAVVELRRHTYSVAIHEGVVPLPERPPASSPAGVAAREDKPRENRRRNAWEATTLTRALHEAASQDYRLCLVLNTMALIGVPGFDLKREDGKASRREPSNRIFSDTLQAAFDRLRTILTEDYDGSELKPQPPFGGMEAPYIPSISARDEGVAHVFKVLNALPEEELQRLFAQLTAVMISHGHGDVPWDSEIKRIVARETRLDVARYVDAAEEAYLQLHTKAELADLAQAAGVVLDVSTMTKQTAVQYLSKSEKIGGYLPARLLPPAPLPEGEDQARDEPADEEERQAA